MPVALGYQGLGPPWGPRCHSDRSSLSREAQSSRTMGLCPSATVPGPQSQLPGPGGLGFRSALRPVYRAVGLEKGMRRLLLVGLPAVALRGWGQQWLGLHGVGSWRAAQD